MTDQKGTDTGWRPLTTPGKGGRPPEGVRPTRLSERSSAAVTSFVRLARAHAFHAAGDATYAVALVGSIFALDTDAARGRILLYLLLTLAPFALVGPFIGPALDRMKGGRRLMIIGTLAVRAALMILLIRNIETFWLFPIAFTQLVMGKTYSVAKAATVPTTVNSEEELVDKNARLAVLGTVAGGLGAAPALGLQALFGSSPTLVYAFLVYTVGVVMATRMPRVMVDDPDVPDDEVDLRSAGVRLAASAMSVMRGIAGFVFWLMVFAYGNNDIDTSGVGKAAGLAIRAALGFSIEGDDSQPAWKLGFVLASIGLGIFLGNVLAPRVRQRVTEEHMIIGALGAILLAAIGAVWAGGLSGAVLFALVVGAAPACAKLAFDSLVQRDAPGANHGAAFGRFETRFQIASVIGSVIAVAPTVIIPVRAGGVIVALAALLAGAAYLLGSRALRTGEPSPWSRLFGDDTGGSVPVDDGGTGDSNGAARAADATGAPERASAAQPVIVHQAAPTTQVPAVSADRPPAEPSTGAQPSPPAAPIRPEPPTAPAPAPTPRAVDPYEQAFEDRPIEPPDWASQVFEEDAAGDELLPPSWLDDDRAPISPDDPTPPFGTPRV
ncbi:MAG: MFS transporter [Actinomycetota bacterium]